MSSFSSNAESVRFQITGSELSQFYNTSNCQCFTSKSLTIKNIIHFQVKIYPSGMDKKNNGNVVFIVVPTKFESNLKSVTVCCKLYSPTLQIMFKELQTLHKPNDTMEWSQYQLQLSECKKIIEENAIKYLEFVCDIKILKIKYKSNNSGSRKWSLSTRKQSSSSLSSMDINVFQSQAFPVKSHVHIEWNITNQMVHLFKNTLYGKSYYSQDINNMWSLCVFPTGSKINSTNNHFELVLKLMRLPPEIKTIAVDFAIQTNRQSNELTENLFLKKNILFHYKKTQESAMLFETSKLDKLDSFKMIIIIKITKVFKDVGKNGMGQQVKDLWSNYQLDEFPPGQFEFNIDYGQNDDYKNKDYYVDDAKTSYSSVPTIPNIIENISISPSTTLPDGIPKTDSYLSLQVPSTGRNNSITSYRSSITSCRMVDNHNETDDKKDAQQNHSNAPKMELWESKIDKEKEMKQETNEIITKQNDEKKLDKNLYTCSNKFKRWLCDDVQKQEYLQNFIENGCVDSRLIKCLDNDMLVTFGIKNEFDRKIILDEATAFKQGQYDFEELIKKYDVLKSFEKHFRNNEIFTKNDLFSIQTEQELQKILNIEMNDVRISVIWNILHPSQSQNICQSNELMSMEQMHKFEKQYKLCAIGMDKWLPIMMTMRLQTSKSPIQQQATALLNAHLSRVSNHRCMIEQLFTSEKLGLSTNSDAITTDESLSKSKLSNNKRGSFQESHSSSQHTSSSSGNSDYIEYNYSSIDDSNKVLGLSKDINNNEDSSENKNEIIKKPLLKVNKNPFILEDSNDNGTSK